MCKYYIISAFSSLYCYNCFYHMLQHCQLRHCLKMILAQMAGCRWSLDINKCDRSASQNLVLVPFQYSYNLTICRVQAVVWLSLGSKLLRKTKFTLHVIFTFVSSVRHSWTRKTAKRRLESVRRRTKDSGAGMTHSVNIWGWGRDRKWVSSYKECHLMLAGIPNIKLTLLSMVKQKCKHPIQCWWTQLGLWDVPSPWQCMLYSFYEMILEANFCIKFIPLSVNFDFTLENVFIHIFHPSIFYSFFCLKILATNDIQCMAVVWKIFMFCGAWSEVIRQILM